MPVTGVQVPSLACTLQASHWPGHLSLQQKPSTHWPLEHWLSPVQPWPSVSLGTHEPPEQ
jgi:hypothetical protein